MRLRSPCPNCEKQHLLVGRLEYYKRATWNDLQLLTLHYISLRASSTFTLLQQQLPSSISCILLPATVIRTNAIQIRSGRRGIGWLGIRFITVLIKIICQSIQDGGKKVTVYHRRIHPSFCDLSGWILDLRWLLLKCHSCENHNKGSHERWYEWMIESIHRRLQ